MNQRNRAMFSSGMSTATVLAAPMFNPHVPGLAKLVLGVLMFGGISIAGIAIWRHHVESAKQDQG